MSPKQITKIAFIAAAISILGIIVMAVVRPEWGVLNWWPAMGLALSLLLLLTSFLKGAYLASQKRVELVDMLNDCYTGTSQAEQSQ